jgi:hypothetical protein
MRRIIVLVLIALVVVPVAVSGCGKTAKVSRTLVGRWTSTEREYMPNPDGSVYYVIRDYTFTGDAFRFVKTIYGDPYSDIVFFVATLDGTYEIAGESKAVPGAFEIDLAFSKVTMVPESLAFVDIFMRSGCGDGMWGLDVPQDVSKTGCLTFRSIDAYPKEYDIIKIEGDSLFFGKPPEDGDMGSSKKRPAHLMTVALSRQAEK